MNRPTAIYSAARCARSTVRDRQRKRAGLHADDARRRGALKISARRWPQAKRVAVVCGGGNNGGDGYVLARLAQPRARSAGARRDCRRTADGRRARAQDDGWRRRSAHPFAADALAGSDVIVDALLGIGLRAAAPETLAVIQAINAARRPVLALDIPSGVDADSGAVHGAAVRADSR
jgi:NAD(P)H-hydrate epimerase